MNLMNFPFLVLVLSFLVLLATSGIGDILRQRGTPLNKEERDDFDVVLGAVLTLLVLIIGFSFSMAITRYDQRKNYEEAEANHIGTEYLRADLLPTDDAARGPDALRNYLDRRVAVYRAGEHRLVDQVWEQAGQ